MTKLAITTTIFAMFALVVVLVLSDLDQRLEKLETDGPGVIIAPEPGEAGHAAVIRVIGDWDCHIEVNERCYIIEPDGSWLHIMNPGFMEAKK